MRRAAPVFPLTALIACLCAVPAQGTNLHIEKKCHGLASHVATVNCLSDEEERLQKTLDALLAEHAKEAGELEKLGKELDSVMHEDLAKELSDGQKSFNEYVEHHCAYQARLLGTGTAAADVTVLCRIRLLRERINLLKGRLPCYGDTE